MGFSDPAPPAALRIALVVVLREMSQVLPPTGTIFGGKAWIVSVVY
jgi:hypothetical protein